MPPVQWVVCPGATEEAYLSEMPHGIVMTAGSFTSLTALHADFTNWERVQYEVHLLTGGLFQVGWCVTASGLPFTLNEGVGDFPLSVAVDGSRGMLWNVTGEPVPSLRWQPGDIVSCYADFSTGTFDFALNGVYCCHCTLPTKGSLLRTGARWYTDRHSTDEMLTYAPALSLGKGEACVVNIGEAPMCYPRTGFISVTAHYLYSATETSSSGYGGTASEAPTTVNTSATANASATAAGAGSFGTAAFSNSTPRSSTTGSHSLRVCVGGIDIVDLAIALDVNVVGVSWEDTWKVMSVMVEQFVASPRRAREVLLRVINWFEADVQTRWKAFCVLVYLWVVRYYEVPNCISAEYYTRKASELPVAASAVWPGRAFTASTFSAPSTIAGTARTDSSQRSSSSLPNTGLPSPPVPSPSASAVARGAGTTTTTTTATASSGSAAMNASSSSDNVDALTELLDGLALFLPFEHYRVIPGILIVLLQHRGSNTLAARRLTQRILGDLVLVESFRHTWVRDTTVMASSLLNMFVMTPHAAEEEAALAMLFAQKHAEAVTRQLDATLPVVESQQSQWRLAGHCVETLLDDPDCHGPLTLVMLYLISEVRPSILQDDPHHSSGRFLDTLPFTFGLQRQASVLGVLAVSFASALGRYMRRHTVEILEESEEDGLYCGAEALGGLAWRDAALRWLPVTSFYARPLTGGGALPVEWMDVRVGGAYHHVSAGIKAEEQREEEDRRRQREAAAAAQQVPKAGGSTAGTGPAPRTAAAFAAAAALPTPNTPSSAGASTVAPSRLRQRAGTSATLPPNVDSRVLARRVDPYHMRGEEHDDGEESAARSSGEEEEEDDDEADEERDEVHLDQPQAPPAVSRRLRSAPITKNATLVYEEAHTSDSAEENRPKVSSVVTVEGHSDSDINDDEEEEEPVAVDDEGDAEPAAPYSTTVRRRRTKGPVATGAPREQAIIGEERISSSAVPSPHEDADATRSVHRRLPVSPPQRGSRPSAVSPHSSPVTAVLSNPPPPQQQQQHDWSFWSAQVGRERMLRGTFTALTPAELPPLSSAADAATREATETALRVRGKDIFLITALAVNAFARPMLAVTQTFLDVFYNTARRYEELAASSLPTVAPSATTAPSSMLQPPSATAAGPLSAHSSSPSSGRQEGSGSLRSPQPHAQPPPSSIPTPPIVLNALSQQLPQSGVYQLYGSASSRMGDSAPGSVVSTSYASDSASATLRELILLLKSVIPLRELHHNEGVLHFMAMMGCGLGYYWSRLCLHERARWVEMGLTPPPSGSRPDGTPPQPTTGGGGAASSTAAAGFSSSSRCTREERGVNHVLVQAEADEAAVCPPRAFLLLPLPLVDGFVDLWLFVGVTCGAHSTLVRRFPSLALSFFDASRRRAVQASLSRSYLYRAMASVLGSGSFNRLQVAQLLRTQEEMLAQHERRRQRRGTAVEGEPVALPLLQASILDCLDVYLHDDNYNDASSLNFLFALSQEEGCLLPPPRILGESLWWLQPRSEVPGRASRRQTSETRSVSHDKGSSSPSTATGESGRTARDEKAGIVIRVDTPPGIPPPPAKGAQPQSALVATKASATADTADGLYLNAFLRATASLPTSHYLLATLSKCNGLLTQFSALLPPKPPTIMSTEELRNFHVKYTLLRKSLYVVDFLNRALLTRDGTRSSTRGKPPVSSSSTLPGGSSAASVIVPEATAVDDGAAFMAQSQEEATRRALMDLLLQSLIRLRFVCASPPATTAPTSLFGPTLSTSPTARSVQAQQRRPQPTTTTTTMTAAAAATTGVGVSSPTFAFSTASSSLSPVGHSGGASGASAAAAAAGATDAASVADSNILQNAYQFDRDGYFSCMESACTVTGLLAPVLAIVARLLDRWGCVPAQNPFLAVLPEVDVLVSRAQLALRHPAWWVEEEDGNRDEALCGTELALTPSAKATLRRLQSQLAEVSAALEAAAAVEGSSSKRSRRTRPRTGNSSFAASAAGSRSPVSAKAAPASGWATERSSAYTLTRTWGTSSAGETEDPESATAFSASPYEGDVASRSGRGGGRSGGLLIRGANSAQPSVAINRPMRSSAEAGAGALSHSGRLSEERVESSRATLRNARLLSPVHVAATGQATPKEVLSESPAHSAAVEPLSGAATDDDGADLETMASDVTDVEEYEEDDDYEEEDEEDQDEGVGEDGATTRRRAQCLICRETIADLRFVPCGHECCHMCYTRYCQTLMVQAVTSSVRSDRGVRTGASASDASGTAALSHDPAVAAANSHRRLREMTLSGGRPRRVPGASPGDDEGDAFHVDSEHGAGSPRGACPASSPALHGGGGDEGPPLQPAPMMTASSFTSPPLSEVRPTTVSCFFCKAKVEQVVKK